MGFRKSGNSEISCELTNSLSKINSIEWQSDTMTWHLELECQNAILKDLEFHIMNLTLECVHLWT